MAKPILVWTDSRVKKIWGTHAALCRRFNKQTQVWEYRWFHLDNLQDKEVWQRIRVARLAISGLTISEAIKYYNDELKRFRIKSAKQVVPKQVPTSEGQE